MKQEIFREVYERVKEGKAAEARFFVPEEADAAGPDGEGRIDSGAIAPDEEGGVSAERSYIRRWTPRERLILLGGGHVALPLCKIAAMTGFSVTVVDDRPEFANRLRFPEAECVICDDFIKALDELQPGAFDYVCVITRGHRYDAACVRDLLKRPEQPRYFGMIGSKRRVAGLMGVLREEGYPEERLSHICAPIGLPLRAQTTAEIAVSIVAQLVEYRRMERGKRGEYLIMDDTDLPLLEALSEGAGKLTAALVIATKGSTPVKSGALMAVDELGHTKGTIGGGCSEGEIIQAARRMVGKGEHRVMQVDMTNDVAAEEGMVCGGIMDVLVESVGI